MRVNSPGSLCFGAAGGGGGGGGAADSGWNMRMKSSDGMAAGCPEFCAWNIRVNSPICSAGCGADWLRFAASNMWVNSPAVVTGAGGSGVGGCGSAGDGGMRGSGGAGVPATGSILRPNSDTGIRQLPAFANRSAPAFGVGGAAGCGTGGGTERTQSAKLMARFQGSVTTYAVPSCSPISTISLRAGSVRFRTLWRRDSCWLDGPIKR